MSGLKGEAVRKAIHFAGIGYIPAIIYLGRTTVFYGVIVAFFIAFMIEFFRRKYGFFRCIVRDYEEKGIPAYIHFAIALVIVTGLFAASACIAAIATAITGDGVAGIVKKFYSKNTASVAMFLSSLAVVLCLQSYLLLLPAVATCLVATVVERVEKVCSIYINDNLSVPIAAAVCYSVVSVVVS